MRQWKEIQEVLWLKQLIPLGITAFWLVMMAILIQREVLVPRATPEQITVPQDPSDVWMGIYTLTSDGTEQRIGYLHTVSMPYQVNGDNGTRYSLTLKLTTPVLTYPVEILLKGSSRVLQGKGLQDFDFTLQSYDDHVIRAEGKAVKDKLQIAIHTAIVTTENTPAPRKNGRNPASKNASRE